MDDFSGDLSNWNTQSATTMEAMFSLSLSFVGAGIESWDLSSVCHVHCAIVVVLVCCLFSSSVMSTTTSFALFFVLPSVLNNTRSQLPSKCWSPPCLTVMCPHGLLTVSPMPHRCSTIPLPLVKTCVTGAAVWVLLRMSQKCLPRQAVQTQLPLS